MWLDFKMEWLEAESLIRHCSYFVFGIGVICVYGIKNIEENSACSDTNGIPHIAVATDEVTRDA